jgi:hypothetical protein
VSDDGRNSDPFQVLAEHAKHLNAISTPEPGAEVWYEIWSGALRWSDETNSKTPVEVFGALNFIVAYRTSLMLGKPREVLKPVWEHALTLFPNWVGFRPERRQPTPELLKIYRRGDVSLRKCLRKIEREMEQEAAEADAATDGARDRGS